MLSQKYLQHQIGHGSVQITLDLYGHLYDDANREAAKKTEAFYKTESKKAPASGSGLYYVQVGAFTEKSQAQALAEKYKKQGYTTVVAEPRATDSKAHYRVRLGGYTSRDRAAALLNKINAAAGRKTDYYIVRD